jgi:hypothetical protein
MDLLTLIRMHNNIGMELQFPMLMTIAFNLVMIDTVQQRQ